MDRNCTCISSKERESQLFRLLSDPTNRRTGWGVWMSTLAISNNTHDLVDTTDH